MKLQDMASALTGVPGPVERRIYERHSLDAGALPTDVRPAETAIIYAERAIEVGGRVLFTLGATAIVGEMINAISMVGPQR